MEEEKRCGGSWRMNDVLTSSSDVWMDIFLRLPTLADLLSLKAVCKTFHQLISSDLFFWKRLNKDFKSTTAVIISTNPIAPNLLYDPEKRIISVWHTESRFDNWSTHHHAASNLNTSHRVLDSYLGLLLIRVCRGSLMICSPIKSSYHLLPSISSSFSLHFPCWKIAYDDASEKYKVFGLDIIKRNQVSLYVFDGKSHLHSKTTTSMELEGRYNIIMMNVLVNGNVYWLILAAERRLRWSCVVSVNATTEEVKTRICSTTTTPFPVLVPSVDTTDFFAANGTFYFHEFTHSSTRFDIWFLEGIETENPKPTWMMKHRISICRISIPFITQYHKTRVLGLFQNKILFKIIPGQQYYQYDTQYDPSSSRCGFEKVTAAKADYIEPELIGDDIKCEMSMGPVDITTQVSVGFIPLPT